MGLSNCASKTVIVVSLPGFFALTMCHTLGISAIGVGLAALLCLWGGIDGVHTQTVENVTSLYTGHIQIHAKGFHKRMKLEKAVPDPKKVAEILKSNPLVKNFSYKIKTDALAGTAEQSSGVLVFGVDPLTEKAVTNLQDYITEGEYLGAEDHKSILLGHKLMERLEVKLNDKIVVLTQEKGGAMGGMAYRVKGVFKTGSDFLDEATVWMTFESAKNVLALDGEISEITIRIHNIKDLETVKNDILRELGPEADAYEVMTWYEVAPEVQGFIEFDNVIVTGVLLVVALVISIGVMNTILMSTFERTKEFGVLKAIGMRPWQITWLVVLEVFFLDLIGVFSGIVLWAAITFYFRDGISIAQYTESLSSAFMPTSIVPGIETHHFWYCVQLMLFLPIIISFFAAVRAGRLETVKAIYHS